MGTDLLFLDFYCYRQCRLDALVICPQGTAGSCQAQALSFCNGVQRQYGLQHVGEGDGMLSMCPAILCDPAVRADLRVGYGQLGPVGHLSRLQEVQGCGGGSQDLPAQHGGCGSESPGTAGEVPGTGVAQLAGLFKNFASCTQAYNTSTCSSDRPVLSL